MGKEVIYLQNSGTEALVTASIDLNTITFTKADGTVFNITVDTGSGGGGGSGDATFTQDVSQSAHGFVVGDIIRSSGVDNEYTTSMASDSASAEVVGIVTAVDDVNNFEFTYGGIISSSLVPNETAGTVLFLSPTVDGEFTTTQPNSFGQVDKPLAIVLESEQKLLWVNYRGAFLGGESATDFSLFLTASFTASVIVTASAVDNVLTFEKGDGSTFDVTINTGSGGGGGSVDTSSLLVTASVSNNTITFEKGDSSTFDLTINTGSTPGLDTVLAISSSSAGHNIVLGPDGSFGTKKLIFDTNFSNGGEIYYNGASFLTIADRTNQGIQVTGSSVYIDSEVLARLTSGDWGLEISTGGAFLSTNVGNLEFPDDNGIIALVSDVDGITASIDLSALNTFTASYFIDSASFQSRIADSIVTASLSGSTLNTIIFEKDDGTTFELTIDTGSAGGIGGIFIQTGSFYATTNDLQITGSVKISSSLEVSDYITASKVLISSSGVNQLDIYGSGSSNPIIKVTGGSGELFTIADESSGSILAVNSSSGETIFEVLSDKTTRMGDTDYPFSYRSKQDSIDAGSTVIYQLNTASYDGAFYEYVLKNGNNARSGNIMATWVNSTITYTEVATTDIGDTSDFGFAVILSGSFASLTGSCSTNGWTLKTIIKSI